MNSGDKDRMKKLSINFRALPSARRYFTKIVKGCDESSIPYSLIAPQKPLSIVRAHLWEQLVLPRLTKKEGLLWSPLNSGPAYYRNQVVTIHDILHLDRPDLHVNGFRVHQFYSWMLPRLVKSVRKIITVSDFTRQRLIERLSVSEDKINVVHLAPDNHFFPASQDEILKVQDKYHIPNGHYVLALGAIDLKKNLKSLVRAWAVLRASSSLARDDNLVLAGKQHNRTSLKGLGLDELPENIFLTGFIEDEDLPALYSGASVFVFPSLYEGFGIPPLEAMACGTPVVVSNVTSLPEVCGDAAVYVDPNDVESIADGIRCVLESTSIAEGLKEKGLRRAKNFSWERCVELHIQIFKECLGEI